VDLDAYVAAHAGQWQRLETLTRQRRLSGPESDELVDCYQQVATHLSVVRSSAPDPALVAYLSGLLARARTRGAGTRTMTWSTPATFFAATFPAALYRTRRWWVATMVISLGAAAVMTWWLMEHPQVESSLMSPRQIQRLVDVEFERYYSEHAASHFAAQVWTNNAMVAAMCLAFGVLGFPVVYLLFNNLVNLAVVASVMIRHDRGSLFFGLILPHGLLELTAVFVAAGVGLRFFWAWVDPGHLPRGQALAREGRTAAGVALGLVAVLLVSGVVEAFVTPSGLPTWGRIGVGVVVELLFLGYVYVAGRAAYRRGHTGDVDSRGLPDTVATAG
jgi:uncharacterized membrane protein SpoIIM required for sporulation